MPEDNMTTMSPSTADNNQGTSMPTPVADTTDASPQLVDNLPPASPQPVVQETTQTEVSLPLGTQDAQLEVDSSSSSIYFDIASKISESHNVLIALSSDPSVDEMAAAIGLSLYLDKLGKRATAIYSGKTPNALEFLKPEETFEPSADTLQDFVIALNKEKADHLRYKIDGDYVKIFITPYRTRISAEDLEFSYGDYNVDLVLALDVANGIDLDSALREHGRIMHDAIIINITTGNPGKLGEIEWSDKKASSVSEMIAKLLYSVKSDTQIEKEEATAFLTGIVAATNRFSNAHTTPETMQISGRLMRSGANQQLIAKNITPDIDNEMYSLLTDAHPDEGPSKPKAVDPTKLNIGHDDEEGPDDEKEISTTVTEKESTLLDDLKAAEASLAQTGAETMPDLSHQPIRLDPDSISQPKEPDQEQPAEDRQPEEPSTPLVEEPSEPEPVIATPAEEPPEPVADNPAASLAPAVAPEPEINGVPEMNFMPPAGESILPPPPAPPIDMTSDSPDASLPLTPIEPATPVEEPTLAPLGPQPAMQDQVYQPHASSPGSFQIPGM